MRQSETLVFNKTVKMQIWFHWPACCYKSIFCCLCYSCPSIKSVFLHFPGFWSSQPLHQLLRRGLYGGHGELRQQGGLLQRSAQARRVLPVQGPGLHDAGPVFRDELVAADPDGPGQHGRPRPGFHHPDPLDHLGNRRSSRLEIEVWRHALSSLILIFI